MRDLEWLGLVFSRFLAVLNDVERVWTLCADNSERLPFIVRFGSAVQPCRSSSGKVPLHYLMTFPIPTMAGCLKTRPKVYSKPQFDVRWITFVDFVDFRWAVLHGWTSTARQNRCVMRTSSSACSWSRHCHRVVTDSLQKTWTFRLVRKKSMASVPGSFVSDIFRLYPIKWNIFPRLISSCHRDFEPLLLSWVTAKKTHVAYPVQVCASRRPKKNYKAWKLTWLTWWDPWGGEEFLEFLYVSLYFAIAQSWFNWQLEVQIHPETSNFAGIHCFCRFLSILELHLHFSS